MAASGIAFGESHPSTFDQVDQAEPSAEATRGHWFSLSENGDHGNVGPTWVGEKPKGSRCADDPRDT